MKYFIVDAFTGSAFTGNPAVFLLEESVSDDVLQNIALEMNLSETAYLLGQGDIYNIRWFSPTKEVDLCGHATLASAHILWETNKLNRGQEVKFNYKNGVLVARKVDEFIEMDFPLDMPNSSECPKEIMSGLKVTPVYVGKTRFDYFVEVGSEDIVCNIVPDIEVIKRIDCRGVVVTSSSHNKEYDFVSRFFAPRFGINEDPVTGSAHCSLAPYWGKKMNKSEVLGYQASKRGGFVRAKVSDQIVVLGGKARVVAMGEFFV